MLCIGFFISVGKVDSEARAHGVAGQKHAGGVFLGRGLRLCLHSRICVRRPARRPRFHQKIDLFPQVDFLSIAKAMAYHHAKRVSHHRRCISSREACIKKLSQ